MRVLNKTLADYIHLLWDLDSTILPPSKIAALAVGLGYSRFFTRTDLFRTIQTQIRPQFETIQKTPALQTRLWIFLETLIKYDLHSEFMTELPLDAVFEGLKNLMHQVPNFETRAQTVQTWLTRPRHLEQLQLSQITVPKVGIFDSDVRKHIRSILEAPVGFKAGNYKHITQAFAQVLRITMALAWFQLRVTDLFVTPDHSVSILSQQLNQFATHWFSQPNEIRPMRLFEWIYDLLEALIDLKDFQTCDVLQACLTDSPTGRSDSEQKILRTYFSAFHQHEINLNKYWRSKFNHEKQLLPLTPYESVWSIPCLAYYEYQIPAIFETLAQDAFVGLLQLGALKQKILDSQIKLAQHLQQTKPFFSNQAFLWLQERIQALD